MMKPILFSTAMVQAILAGRKTQTRRVVKESVLKKRRNYECWLSACALEGKHPAITSERDFYLEQCPVSVGDILWVRETWAEDECDKCRAGIPALGGDCSCGYVYRATSGGNWKWRPSIYMPKGAARLFLRVTDVRVERLQEILCGDMKREGCIPDTVTGGQYQQWQRDYWIPLWDSINDKRGYPWRDNPWVWVYEFEQCENEEE